MTCNASDLVNAAKCYCFPKGMAGAIQAWLLCKWAQIEIENPPPPCEFSIALDGPGRVILSWGNPVVYDLIEVWHAPLFGPRHLETTLPGTDTSWTTPILAPGDYFIIRGKIGDDYSGFATGDTCPPIPPACSMIEWSPGTAMALVNDDEDASTLAQVQALDPASIYNLYLSYGPAITSVSCFTLLTGLVRLTISNNALTSLDLSGCSNLQILDCSNNLLGTLNITGDFAITSLNFSSNPAVVIIGP